MSFIVRYLCKLFTYYGNFRRDCNLIGLTVADVECRFHCLVLFLVCLLSLAYALCLSSVIISPLNVVISYDGNFVKLALSRAHLCS